MSSPAALNLSLIGVPFSGGQPRGGVDLGPGAMREGGLKSLIEASGWNIVCDEDIKIRERSFANLNKLKEPVWVGNVCEDLAVKVQHTMADGSFCLTLGGDHSIAAGSIAGVLKNNPDTFVVWVDAHADINTPETTDSGNLHGMPVAFLAKIAGTVQGFEYLQNFPTLRPDRILYVGLRDVDLGEKDILQEKNIRQYSAQDVATRGIAAITEEILEVVKGFPIHISFDIDALDPAHAPATGTPVSGGMTLDDGKHLCQKLAATGRVTSMDMVEVNPSLGDKEAAAITVKSALDLIKATLDARRSNA